MKKRMIVVAVVAVVIVAAVLIWLQQKEEAIALSGGPLALYSDGALVAEISSNDLLDLEGETFTLTQQSKKEGELTLTYTGVALADLLAAYEVDVAAVTELLVVSSDGYFVTVTGDEIRTEDNVYLAYALDGAALASLADGGKGPYQLVIRADTFATRWNQDVVKIDVN